MTIALSSCKQCKSVKAFGWRNSMKRRFSLFVLTALAVGLLLQANLGADDKKAKEPAKPIVIDDQWINADLKDRIHSENFMKSYTFTLEKDKAYLIEVTSKNRPCIRLETAAGAQV